ncbi:MAG: nucleoside-diphosphate kinase [Acidobacteria bacterium]|jgi:nucleoside-diphosphate kinase|nr:nucleoside-diphosphate kinase [Acidobacteriota bacterium]
MSSLTFGIIKPDAVKKGHSGKIIDKILAGGFTIRGMKLIHMTKKEAEGFYAVHAERPFYGELTEFMSSAPCVVMALEKENAVKAWRDLMGATNPAEAEVGTLRREFAGSIGENAVHGSDSDENATIEVSYFFSKLELV